MPVNTALFEATQSEANAINGLQRSLFIVKPLAMVFPSSASTGISYKIGREAKKQNFPPSLSSVIYAIFHRNDDPEYFNAINMSIASNRHNEERYSFDQYTQVLKPIVSITGKGGIKDRLKKARTFANEPEINSTNIGEAADIISGFLTSPNILTDDVGKTFETDLIDTIEFARPEGTDSPMLDRLGKIKRDAWAEYTRGLAFKWDLPNGEQIVPNRNRIRKITLESPELAVFIACRMSENFATDVFSSAESIDNAVKSAFSTEGAESQRSFQDVLDYATEWVEGNGHVARGREHRTGDDATDYIPLDIQERNDLVRASVAPEYVITMFACDCRKFQQEDMGDDVVGIGYKIIAKALGVPDSDPDAINNYIASQLATDTQKAKSVRERAIDYVKSLRKGTNDQRLMAVINRILRHTFQYKNDELYSFIPGIAGAGDEIRHRHTGVDLDCIASKITGIFPPSSGKYMVIADENPDQNGIPSTSDAFTVNIDGIEETFSRSDEEKLHNYERPALVKFEDTESSYPVYAIWQGVVPYSKVVDNRTTYDIAQSPETIAAREGSGEELVKGAMQSVRSRTTLGALGAEVGSSGKTLTRDEIENVANQMASMDSRYKDLMKGTADVSDEDLRNYVLLSAVQYYNGVLNNSFNRGDANDENVLAYRSAAMRVLGDPSVILTPVPSNDIVDKIIDTYSEERSARTASGGDEEAVGEIVDAYLSDFFDWIDNADVAGSLSKFYADNVGGKERYVSNDLRSFDKDLLTALGSVVSGYGYLGLRLLNTYKGGRYSFNNRLMLSQADPSRPIGDYTEGNLVHAMRNRINDTVYKPVAQGLHVAVSDKARATEMLKSVESSVKSSGIVDAGVMDNAIKEAMDATGGYDAPSAIAYGILCGAIRGNCWLRKMVQKIDLGYRDGKEKGSPIVQGIRPDEAVPEDEIRSRLAGNKSFENALKLLDYIHELSNGGADFKPISEVMDNVNSGANRTTYAALMGAVDACRKTAERIGNVERHMMSTGSVDTGIRQNIGNDVDLEKTAGEDELANVADTEDADNNVSDYVESALEEWKPTTGYDTYHGLTGYTGFDTIRVGTAGDTEMANSLANPETVTKGINPYAVAICSRVIDDARNHYDRLAAYGPKGEFAITSRNVPAWADKIVALYAGQYMLSRNTLKRKSVDGQIAINPSSAAEWRKMTDTVLTEIKSMCNANVPEGAASIADEIIQMIDNLEVSGSSMESISNVSTAMAHLILKLGEVSNNTKTVDPLGGQADSSVSIPKEVKDLAAVRAMPKDSTRDEMSAADKKSATELLASAGKSMSGNSDLAKLLSNLYSIYGRDTTEGYADALGSMQAAAHAAGNKTDRAKTEIKGGVAPSKLAADLYKLVWDDEDSGDRSYSGLLDDLAQLGNDEEPVLLGEVLQDAGLNSQVKVGVAKGNTYAGYAFRGSHAPEIPTFELVDDAPDAGRRLALALRMQMVDRLLSDRTFASFRKNPELWEQFSTRVSQQALDLDGTSSAFLFVTLDHAILNLGREVRQTSLHKRVNEDTALSEEYAAEQRIRNSIGTGTDSKIDVNQLSRAIFRYLFSSSADTREEGFNDIKFILGERPAEEFAEHNDADKIREDTSVEQRRKKCNDLAVQLSNTYGKTAKQKMNAGKSNDEAFKKQVNTLRTALRVVATGEPDGNGHTASDYENTLVPNILGKSLSDAFLSAFKNSIPDGANINANTFDMLVSKFLDINLHSNNAVVTRLMKNANMDVDVVPTTDTQRGDNANVATDKHNGLKSNVARWNAARETGGVGGRGTFKAENDIMQEKAKEYVESELAKFDADSDDGERNRLYRRLKLLGFKGSVEEFCNKVQEGEASQAALAHSYAFDDSNYMPAFFQKVMGSFSALTPTKSLADENLVADVARGMERLGLHGITMVHDNQSGEETPFVKFSNSPEPRSITSGYAARQLEILMDKFKEVYGREFTDRKGETTDENIRDLDKLMQDTPTRYPVDPVANSREIVPLVLNRLNDKKLTNGQPWATVVGGVKGHRNFERTITKKGKQFVATIAEDVVINIVRSIMRDGKFTGSDGKVKTISSSELTKEIEQIRKFKRSEVSGVITELAKAVKSGIDKRIRNLIKTMVGKGDVRIGTGGIKVVWTNPPVTATDPSTGETADETEV